MMLRIPKRMYIAQPRGEEETVISLGLMIGDPRLTCDLNALYGDLKVLKKPKRMHSIVQLQDEEENLVVGDRIYPQFQDGDALVASLKVYAKQKNLEKGNGIHLDIVKRGLFEQDPYVGSILVSLYAKCGALWKANELFEQLQVRDIVSWNALISGYVGYGRGQEAMKCFEQIQQEGFPPDPVTFLCILKVCGRTRAIDKGINIHVQIGIQGFIEKNIMVGTALVDMYAKCGDLEKACEIFNQLRDRNVASWTSLMTGYVQHGRGEEALNCFGQMQREGFTPDAVTFICSLKACGMSRAVEEGAVIHAQVIKEGLLEKSTSVGNALVDMYAKCGALEKAQAVFDKLPVWDVVSWNTLISGYAQHGHAEKVLYCFEQMQREGFMADTVTFLSTLKGCGSRKVIDEGKEIHAQLIKRGLLGKDMVLGTALVDMYAKCGILVEAQYMFDQLLVRDLIAWNALVTGYADHGTGDQALNCFEQMQREGVHPNVVTYVGLLKACSGIEAADKGIEIHDKVLKEGFLEKNMSICNALVDMYAKCGILTRAQELFDEIPIHDAVSWNALISGYAQHEHSEEALNFYECMQREGLCPDEITSVCILKACGSIGADKKGKEIHAKVMNEDWLERNVLVGTALMDMYSKCGALTNAHEVFNQLQMLNIVTWNSLIVGYVQHGHGGKAWYCFDRMQNQSMSPNIETFIGCLRACGNIGAISSGKRIHAEIVGNESLERNVLIGNQLIDMYAKCGALGEAKELFEQLPVRDVVTWTALIAGYVQYGHDHEALGCFRLMEQNSVSPNEFTFVCVLKACGSIRDIDKGEAIYHRVIKTGLLEKNILVGTSLVDMYAKHGDLIRAQEIFRQLQVKTVITWNVLLSGFIQHGHYEEALKYFEQMQCEFSPNLVTFLCILKACSSMGSIDKGIDIHMKVSEDVILRNDILIGNAIVDMYAKCGVPEKAQEVFDDLPVQDVVSWNALISGYAQLGKDRVVVMLFDKMIGEGIKPDMVTFTIVLTTCSHSGLLDKGQMYFQTMRTYFGIVPTLEHYTCMVDLFSRAAQFDEAITLIREMAAVECLPMWTALLGACQKWGNLMLGKLVFERIIGLDEDNTGAYVCMSNIYAAGVMEDDELVGVENEL